MWVLFELSPAYFYFHILISVGSTSSYFQLVFLVHHTYLVKEEHRVNLLCQVSDHSTFSWVWSSLSLVFVSRALIVNFIYFYFVTGWIKKVCVFLLYYLMGF